MVGYQDGRSNTVYMQGFTDHDGISLVTGNIALDMVFYINSYSVINRVEMMTPIGPSIGSLVMDNSHLLSNIDSTANLHAMRPQDIFSGMQTNNITLGSYDITDSRNMIRNKTPLKSSRENSNPVSFTAKILDSYIKTRSNGEFGLGESDIYTSSAHAVYEPRTEHNPVLRYLNSNSDTSGVFTMNDLISLDPNAPNRTNITGSGGVVKTTHRAGATSDWHGSDRETVVANMLAFGITDMMMDTFITRIALHSTNMETGRPITVIVDAKSPAGGDLRHKLDMLKSKLELEIINSISFGNMDTYSIEVQADIYGETWVRVSLSSGPFIDYVVPTFADSRFSPVVTNNINSYNQAVSDFTYVVDRVVENLTSNIRQETSRYRSPTIAY